MLMNKATQWIPSSCQEDSGACDWMKERREKRERKGVCSHWQGWERPAGHRSPSQHSGSRLLGGWGDDGSEGGPLPNTNELLGPIPSRTKKENNYRSSKWLSRLKCLPHRPDSLSSMPRTHAGRTETTSGTVLSLSHVYRTHIHITPIQNNNK